MYVIYNQVNVLALFDNYHIVLNYTGNFVYSLLNSYFVCNGYWTLNIYYYYYYMSQSWLGMVYLSIHVTELTWNGLLMYTCHIANLEWFINVYMSQS